MRTRIFTLLFAIVTSVGTIFAESGTCGENLTWNLTNGVLTISGTGVMTDYEYSSEYPWRSQNESITSIIINEGVTSIGGGAFSDCSSLTSVTIGNSVIDIGSYAFYRCTSLTSPVYNAHVFAYLPTSYSGVYLIPDGIESIAGGAFYDCSGLTGVRIQNSVTSIGDRAFGWCTSLTSINIPNSVISIGNHAFYGCTSLTSPVYNAHVFAYLPTSYSGVYTIPYGIKTIAGGAFANLYNMTSIIIPNSVTSIGEDAFDSCRGLTSIEIPNSVVSIGDGAFHHCSGLTSISLGNSLTSIGNDAFHECTSLTSINIPNSVTSISVNAFIYCTGLTSVVIGNGVTSIGDAAFFYCISLTSLTIGNSVASIGWGNFSCCYALNSVTCLAATPPVFEGDAFENIDCSKIPLRVPAESINAYKAADQWKDFNPILAIEEANEIVYDANKNQKQSSKFLHNGQIFLRGDKTYTLTGQEVR